MNRDDIERAFDLLGIKAARAGIVAEIAVYDGSAIALASDLRTTTGDVYAIFMKEAELLTTAADEVGRDLKLPDDWLNQAVGRTARMGNEDYEENIDIFGNYTRDNNYPVGLRVFIATPQYLLAMKLIANRGDFEIDKARTDMSDIKGLMRVTKIDSHDKLVDLLRKCYSNIPGLTEPKLSFRIKSKIEEALEGYDEDGQKPTWNAR